MTTTMMTNRLTRLGRAAVVLALLFVIACGNSGDAANTPADQHEDELGDEHADEGNAGLVELSEAAFRNTGITVVEVETREVTGATPAATVPAHVEFDPARVMLVSPRTSGRIERLIAVEGDQVRAGQPLAYLLSPAFLTAQRDFVQAMRRAQLLAGTADEEGALALADAARRRLTLLGASDALIERLASGGEPIDLLPIPSPLGGSVIEAHTLAGAAVDAGSPIFTVADLSVLNVVADVPERALPMLRRGQTAEVRLAAYPSERVRGTVDRVRQELDPSTRTVEAVVRVENTRGLLRPGMFASVTLATGAEAPRVQQLVLPAAAIMSDGGERYVFVEVAPRTFERRAVDTEPLADDQVIVRSGLAPGERVVTRGAFTLQSELGKAEFGGHDH